MDRAMAFEHIIVERAEGVKAYLEKHAAQFKGR